MEKIKVREREMKNAIKWYLKYEKNPRLYSNRMWRYFQSRFGDNYIKVSREIYYAKCSVLERIEDEMLEELKNNKEFEILTERDYLVKRLSAFWNGDITAEDFIELDAETIKRNITCYGTINDIDERLGRSDEDDYENPQEKIEMASELNKALLFEMENRLSNLERALKKLDLAHKIDIISDRKYDEMKEDLEASWEVFQED